MSTVLTQYEYGHNTSDLDPHSNLLLPVVLSMLSDQAKQSVRPLKILDLGCGNGSMSAAIAQHGYDVTGIEEAASGIALAQKTFQTVSFRKAAFMIPLRLTISKPSMSLSRSKLSNIYFSLARFSMLRGNVSNQAVASI